MKHRKLVFLSLLLQHFVRYAFCDSLPCLPTPAPNDPCFSINSWSDFEAIIKYHPSNINSTTPLILCPFSIQKSTTSALRIKKHIQIICLARGECLIETSALGGVSILKIDIDRENSSVIIQGINFFNSASAVQVSSKVSSEAVFCNCWFNRLVIFKYSLIFIGEHEN